MKTLKRLFGWREVKEEAEFDVVYAPQDSGVAVDAAEALMSADHRADRELPQRPGVFSLEGDLWAVHAENGTVYLSGENGVVQVQFAPVDAFSLGSLLQDAARR